ncbi:hypothetical protein SAMN05444396_10714 [Flavobacterium segetis]|uniref:Uncharacterized protein n=1 Tax=Flavobacterium segetis TaxID=271157 RepID=A0A1M5IFB6_9FLAO|nr:hypothetical protein SAMN05444396_10714 [Flavobacterium segetis]
MHCLRWAATNNGGVLPLKKPLNPSVYAIKKNTQKIFDDNNDAHRNQKSNND